MAHIHHVQICVQNGTKYLQKFTRNANFQLFAMRRTASLRQWAVRSGSIVFLITDTAEEGCAQQRKKSPGASETTTSTNGDFGKTGVETLTDVTTSEPVRSLTLPDHCFLEPSQYPTTPSATHSVNQQQRDTVFNVAFEVSDVTDVLTRAESIGAKVLCRPTVVSNSTSREHVTIAAVQSCIGNVVHTLIDCSNYNGVFLPGFLAADNAHVDLNSGEPVMDCNFTMACKIPHVNGELPACLTNHIDHVTFACPMGSSSQVLEWYERCFGMKRFLLTGEESESDGFLVQGKNVGLRLKAMEYWYCAETGLTLPADQEKWEDGNRPRPPKAKFVIAEALPGHGPNQVETFLEQHGCAGIQHIGLNTHNILQAVSTLRQSGLSFIDPPPAYYTQLGKLTEISRIRDDVELLQKMGILLDDETSRDEDGMTKQGGDEALLGRDGKIQCKYLMQVFSKPIFERDTFFLEIIQRHGASGFGAGNIRALWRAVQSYMSFDDL